jgi:hypothetical protein
MHPDGVDMKKAGPDPREVLEKYVAVLREPSGSVVRSESELAHPKEAIRIVLQHCIRTAANDEAREFLHNSYVSLSTFQQISDAEKEALEVLNGMGPLATEGSKLFSKQARQITHVAGPLQSLLDRISSEHAVLAQELQALAETASLDVVSPQASEAQSSAP